MVQTIRDVQRLEELADPKQLISELLRQASELQGRRLETFQLAVERPSRG